MKKVLTVFLSLTVLTAILVSLKSKPSIYKKLKKYTSTLSDEFGSISEERKQSLKEIGDFIISKRKQHQTAVLTFVCTSNSRRSHLSQIWMQTAALYYGIDSLNTFSGGTEASEVNARAAAALKRAGFVIGRSTNTLNAPYEISVGKEFETWIIYSKKFDDSQNPKGNFGAVMVCSEADKSCPVIPGADKRVSLPYDDPKHYDNTPSETKKYDETCRLIAKEMFFIADYVKKQMILDKESSSN